jgi:hypothetical protein
MAAEEQEGPNGLDYSTHEVGTSSDAEDSDSIDEFECIMTALVHHALADKKRTEHLVKICSLVTGCGCIVDAEPLLIQSERIKQEVGTLSDEYILQHMPDESPFILSHFLFGIFTSSIPDRIAPIPSHGRPVVVISLDPDKQVHMSCECLRNFQLQVSCQYIST